MKRKTYTDQFKIETVRMKRAGMPTEQILKKQDICSSMLANWLKKFPDEPSGAAPAQEKPRTALVVAPKKRMNGHDDGVHDEEKKNAVYALVAKGYTIKDASKEVGVPVTTAYGWRMKDKKKARANGGALVPHKGQPVKATPVQADGITALVNAAEKALINLKEIRRLKLEGIHSHTPGAEIFSDDFCHGQIAYNALARAFGMK